MILAQAYVTFHEETKQCARHQSEIQVKIVGHGDNFILVWMDRGIIPLHKNLVHSFLSAILAKLWLKEVSLVA